MGALKSRSNRLDGCAGAVGAAAGIGPGGAAPVVAADWAGRVVLEAVGAGAGSSPNKSTIGARAGAGARDGRAAVVRESNGWALGKEAGAGG